MFGVNGWIPQIIWLWIPDDKGFQMCWVEHVESHRRWWRLRLTLLLVIKTCIILTWTDGGHVAGFIYKTAVSGLSESFGVLGALLRLMPILY